MASFLMYTPSIRFNNIPIIYRSLKYWMKRYDIKWYICYDSIDPIFNPEVDFPGVYQLSYHENGGVAGNHQRNYILDNCQDETRIAFSLDDDTIIHPDFFPVISEYADKNPNKRAFLFHDQLANDTIFPARMDSIREGGIGNQNFAVRRDLIGNLRANIHYCADGEFISRIYKRSPGDFILIDQVLAFHNRILFRTDFENFMVEE